MSDSLLLQPFSNFQTEFFLSFCSLISLFCAIIQADVVFVFLLVAEQTFHAIKESKSTGADNKDTLEIEHHDKYKQMVQLQF